ncbi:hypothetical protein MCOR27_009928 [Pyricularia oryzae]|uniref:Uncharacterized protein n=4 Tax=Pyricularia TaxID=48558 RepID=A0ABQ8NCN6_PYRGI|nr:hypothetical protein MCOR27_009928 [Pyricularia oryzae]KAI6294513.1 hypothetical protein MCOR33_008390 [Pyricularia grisea]KAI6277016.1 hypothetical protein MCOR26_005370 [Pyricularia oryzae]KAI6295924.1 hypothetical protein MCOR34_009542 [Pyricularia oryzae]KAI6338762.1 hypothetical protein MCOR28_007753 [Pyricularia oryzae]
MHVPFFSEPCQSQVKHTPPNWPMMPENSQRFGNMMHAVAYPAVRLTNVERQVSRLHLFCQGKPVVSELPAYGRAVVSSYNMGSIHRG